MLFVVERGKLFAAFKALNNLELIELTFPIIRFRTAIEEELEVLYDAYYDELESYANHQVRYASSGGTIAPPPGPGPFPGSVDSSTLPSNAPHNSSANSNGTPNGTKGGKKPAVVRTTRDHKNVRPVAIKKKPTNSNRDGPAHGEPGHTHSASCHHHPNAHANNTNIDRLPATTAAKAKGAAVVVVEETYDDDEEEEDDEDGEGEDEEEDDEEYDEDEYDEDEEDEEVCCLLTLLPSIDLNILFIYTVRRGGRYSACS